MDTSYNFGEEFNLQVQKKFLSLLIFDPKWAELNGLDIIKPEYFENRTLHNICQWIHEYHKEYKSIPTKLVLTEKTRDFVNNKGLSTKEYYQYTEVLDNIFTIEEGDDFEFFKDKAIQFVRQVAWKQALEKGGDAFKAGNYEQVLNQFKQILSLGSENDLGMDYSETTTEQFLSVLGETYDKSRMITTGIKGWDDALGGGFVSKNIHLLAAPPGAGKSRTMAYLTKHCLEQMKKVIFITLELSEAETMANINTAVTGITLHEMLNPLYRQQFIEDVNKFKDKHCSDLVVKFFKPGAVTCDTIHNYIQKVIQYKREKLGRDWKPDVIMLDYMDKLLPTQKIKGNIYEDVGGIATDCKNLAITFDCPVITGSQLGRYTWSLSGDQVVSMDSVAESAQKTHLAHSMTTINQNKGEKNAQKARLYLAKSRSGIPNTVVWCDWNIGRCQLTESEPWDPKALDAANDKFSIKSSDSRN